MRLKYFESDNFGDALNPYIFKNMLPSFFDDDPSIDFFGIGSIIGFDMVKEAKKKIIFSSGFAYGTKPIVDNSYDFICVRGPLTAKALHLDEKLAITDGAILLRGFSWPDYPKKYRFSFMPHWESALKYNWKSICEKLNIHYINPTGHYLDSIVEIQQSEIILAEAMHAAIVADTLRTPWIPIKMYSGINEFKWQDWADSLNIPYRPLRLTSLYQDTPFNRSLSKRKISTLVPDTAYGFGLKIYETLQSTLIERKLLKQLNEAMALEPFLSNEKFLNIKFEQLLERLDYVKKKYTK